MQTEFERTLKTALAGSAFDGRIQVSDCVTSTNTLMKQAAEQGLAAPAVWIAHAQTAGRGRLGRSFYSPDRTGLYLSILTRPAWEMQRVSLLTCAAAVAVAQAMEACGSRQIGIKWVNDLFCQGKKVCGILTEASCDSQSNGVRYAVVGIGINLAPPANGFPTELSDIAGAVFDAPPTPAASARLCATLLHRFLALYDRFPALDFLTEYRARSILLGKQVTYCQGEQRLLGTVVDIDSEARLILRDENGVSRAFSCGEISVRPQG